MALRTGGQPAGTTQNGASDQKSPFTGLTQSRILRLYLPLALSWLFMAVEGPITTGILWRMPNPQVNAAALLVMFALSLLIEGPVIDLLSTATTLAKNHQHFIVLRKFALGLIVLVTVVHAAVALTPIYWWVTKSVINVPDEVADVMRPALMVMIPWSAFIGWRRFLHGVMIRWDNTRPIGIGTAIRVAVVLIVGFSLYFFTTLSGVVVAATAMVAGVICESVFIHFVARHTVRRNLDPTKGVQNGLKPLTIGALVRFHTPLTAATVVMIAGMPIIAWGLARAPDSVAAMASWHVAITFMFLFRTVTFALPEAVIALYKDEQSRRALMKFCVRVGAACSALVGLVWLTGLDRIVFVEVLGADPEIVSRASLAFILTGLLPLLNSIAAQLRGVLTAHHLTSARFVAVIFAVAGLFGVLLIGLNSAWDGIFMAAVAATMSLIAELVVLFAFWKVRRPRFADVS